MKIDAHVHITPPDISAGWEKYAEKEPYFSLLAKSKVNKFADAENVIAMMDKESIDKAVVFGFAFKDFGLCRYVNDYVIEKVKQYPEKLTGFTVTPACKKAEAEIERCYKSGLKGVGELFPVGQGFDFDNNSGIKSITGICKNLDIPLLLHVNEPVGHSYAGKTEINFKKLETFISDNMELKIILAHFGGGIFLYESMKEIKEAFKNVYYDTAAAVFLYDYRIYNAVKSLDLCGKLLFGSDFPLLTPSRYLPAFNKSLLCDDDKKIINALNAKKILGL